MCVCVWGTIYHQVSLFFALFCSFYATIVCLRKIEIKVTMNDGNIGI